MLEKLQAKRRESEGFTLMEMLIVVAIIAVLVSIAIPTFQGEMEKAKIAADKAAIRNAQALGWAECYTNYLDDPQEHNLWYNAKTGQLEPSNDTHTPWGMAKENLAPDGHLKQVGVRIYKNFVMTNPYIDPSTGNIVNGEGPQEGVPYGWSGSYQWEYFRAHGRESEIPAADRNK